MGGSSPRQRHIWKSWNGARQTDPKYHTTSTKKTSLLCRFDPAAPPGYLSRPIVQTAALKVVKYHKWKAHQLGYCIVYSPFLNSRVIFKSLKSSYFQSFSIEANQIQSKSNFAAEQVIIYDNCTIENSGHKWTDVVLQVWKITIWTQVWNGQSDRGATGHNSARFQDQIKPKRSWNLCFLLFFLFWTVIHRWPQCSSVVKSTSELGSQRSVTSCSLNRNEQVKAAVRSIWKRIFLVA